MWACLVFFIFIFVGEGKRYWAVGRKQFDVGEVVRGAIVNVNEKAG